MARSNQVVQDTDTETDASYETIAGVMESLVLVFEEDIGAQLLRPKSMLNLFGVLIKM